MLLNKSNKPKIALKIFLVLLVDWSPTTVLRIFLFTTCDMFAYVLFVWICVFILCECVCLCKFLFPSWQISINKISSSSSSKSNIQFIAIVALIPAPSGHVVRMYVLWIESKRINIIVLYIHTPTHQYHKENIVRIQLKGKMIKAKSKLN